MLLERDQELSLLRRVLQDATRGTGSAVLISGEPGIGKTALVNTFTSTSTGVRVLVGICDALVTKRPLSAFLDIQRQMPGPLLETHEAGNDEHQQRDQYSPAGRIELDSLDIDVDGNSDVRSFLGLEGPRAGFENIRATVKVSSRNATEEQLQQLFDHVLKTSPVGDNITNPVPVEPKLEVI